MIKIPLVDLKRQYQTIKKEIDRALLDIVERSSFISGPEINTFERSFAKMCGADCAVAVSSGTTAIYLALMALKIGKGDEVITAPNTFIATTEAISQTGAKVVFADVDDRTLNIDPEKLKKMITRRTKAVIPVHLYGQMCDMDAIMNIARRHHLLVIEDAAQAHLSEFKGKRAGSFGAAGCFSFFPGKNLGAYGDAGAIVTNDKKLAKEMKMLSDHGRIAKYEHLKEGYNYRMDNIQAAILNIKLKYLPRWTEKRRKIAQRYSELFAGTDIKTPYIDLRAKPVYHQYVVRIKNRDKVQGYLIEQGISTGIHYPIALHLQKAYRYLGYKKGDFPIVEKAASEILSLPIFPELTENEMQIIVRALKTACAKSFGA
ncbi:MAG: DegT/DnrJ/EryC1/StrS family aminotransferase [Candidatus Omnitrophota bacterium]